MNLFSLSLLVITGAGGMLCDCVRPQGCVRGAPVSQYPGEQVWGGVSHGPVGLCMPRVGRQAGAWAGSMLGGLQEAPPPVPQSVAVDSGGQRGCLRGAGDVWAQ